MRNMTSMTRKLPEIAAVLGVLAAVGLGAATPASARIFSELDQGGITATSPGVDPFTLLVPPPLAKGLCLGRSPPHGAAPLAARLVVGRT